VEQPTAANKALEAVRELPTVERARVFELPQRRRRELAWHVARPLVDAAMLTVACLAAAIGSEAAGVSAPPLGSLVAFSVLVMLLLALRGMYATRLRSELLEGIRGVVAATSLAAMTVLTLRELLFAEPQELAAQTIRPWAFATAYLAAGRIALHWSRAQARRQGEALRPTLIVGAGRVGRLVAKRLLAHPELGLKPVGFLDKEPMDPDGSVTVPVLGASWDLDEVVGAHGVEQVIVTFSTAPNEVLLRLVRRCEDLGVSVSFVPRLFERVNGRVEVEHIGGLPLVTAHPSNPRGWQFALKYAADRLLAGLAVLLISPVLLGLSAAVLLTMGRPILFRQQRIGRDGRPFDMLKFRTMRGVPADSGEADADWAREQTGAEGRSSEAGIAQSDERRTPLGRFLRSYSLDELPQLLNVLRGEMSLVGPRPERVHYVGLFEESIYRYTDRHRVKAGITGWAQVNGLRGKTSLADRVEWDNYYIENWSLWLDLKIALMTALAVVRSSRQVE
jgi:exopolysaccharide biosynthesis polyprenyl glycosylphosphotransferase